MDVFVRVLNAGLMIALPLGLGVFLARRLGARWRLFWMGAAIFIAAQLLHFPFNAWVLGPALARLGLTGARDSFSLMTTAVLLGLSAGIFEETARYLGYHFWLKDDQDWNAALMFGAGHGGIEALFFGLVALYALIQALVLRNADLGATFPSGQIAAAQAQLQMFWNMPLYLALMGAVERVGALAFHLGASVLVLQAFLRKNVLWWGIAVLWHTLFNALAVYGVQVWGIYTAESLGVLLGGVSLMVVWWLRDQQAVED